MEKKLKTQLKMYNSVKLEKNYVKNINLIMSYIYVFIFPTYILM